MGLCLCPARSMRRTVLQFSKNCCPRCQLMALSVDDFGEAIFINNRLGILWCRLARRRTTESNDYRTCWDGGAGRYGNSSFHHQVLAPVSSSFFITKGFFNRLDNYFTSSSLISNKIKGSQVLQTPHACQALQEPRARQSRQSRVQQKCPNA